MSRANPENVYEGRSWSKDAYGTPDDQSGVVQLLTSGRTYSSVKTSGYPNVKPLPFQNHSVDWRRASYAQIKYYAYTSPFNWARWNAPGAKFGYAHQSITAIVPDSLRFGTSAELRARSKVIQDIQRVKVNVAQNIAEYHQVTGMFHSTVRRFTLAYRALRHGDVRGYMKYIPVRKRQAHNLLTRGPMDIRRSAPNIWLETQYGWLPFLGDIYTGVTEFYKRVESGYPIRARGASTFTDSVSTGVLGTGGVSYVDRTTRRFRNLYIIEYEVDHTNLANMDDWGLTNPSLLAWELLPYSFVVDWFLPVGDWLSQVGYSLGLYFKRGMRTALVEGLTQRWYRPTPGATWVKELTASPDTYTTIRLKREVLGGFPSPGRPRLDRNGLRGKRILNALSLLSLAFDRRG